MAPRKRDGLRAALDGIAAEGKELMPAGPAAEQLALLPLTPSTVERAVPTGGRPAGAINKATKAWRDWLLSRYRSPLEVMAETYSRPVAELAKELGCDRLDAARIQLEAAQQLAPYLHSKMPTEVAVDGGGGQVLALAINLGEPPAPRLERVIEGEG